MRKPVQIAFVTSCLILFYHLSLNAQLQVKNFFTITGKKDVAVNTITQDPKGFLWLGTAEGLYQFDGRESKQVDVNGLLNKDITTLHTDKEQTLWIGTRNGQVYFMKKNQVDSVRFPKPRNTDRITSFCETPGGMCIGTYGNGIFTISRNGVGHFNNKQGLSDNVVYKMTSDGKNTIWCGTDAGITQVTNIFTHPRLLTLSNKDGLPDNIVRDISFDDRQLVIAMQDSGVCFYNLTRQKFGRMPFFSNWTLGTVVNASSGNAGKLLIATEKNGLIHIDKGAFNIYKYDEYQIPAISQMFIDRANQIWIASRKGISRFSEKRYNFIHVSKNPDENKVLALVTDNEKAIWTGTSEGISRITTNEQGHIVVDHVHEGNRFTLSCAALAPDGDIWFGTYGNGIIITGSGQKKTIILNTAKKLLSNDNISNIFFNGNDVYISTLGGGLIKGTVSAESSEQFRMDTTYTEAGGLGSNYIYMALTDKNGKLYVATDGGGLRTTENGKFVDITTRHGFPSNTIYSLCTDRFNNLWATSNDNGVLKYNGRELVSVNRASGLRDDQPQQLVSGDNTVYAINSKGIDKISCLDNSVSYYDLFDGDLEPNLNAVCVSGNKFLSGTNNGVLVYRTSQELLDSLKPTVFIKNLRLNYKPFPLDSISEFRHDQNNFAIEYDGIWLRNPDKLTYRYKLMGLEESWNFASEGKVINYNNLGPGSYTFFIQSKNEEDVWSDPATYEFSILTPVWKRWWFWALMIAVVSVVIYLLVTYRLKTLQRENLLLEQRVKERTSQIEKQSRIIETKNLELEQLSLVASKTDNVVLILDPVGKLEYINESFVKSNKMTVEELKSRYGETIFELSNNPRIREIVEEAVANKHSVTYESRNTKSEVGGEMWESSTLTPIFDDNGKLRKIIIIDTDVTVRKKQEQVILQKNKDITDSIFYARKIQHAILPDVSVIRSYLPQSMVLYMPKDIVSGDFYWFSNILGCSIIAAVDCTGHGVPGAFMSLIGYNVLNRVVNEKRITNPGEILKELNNAVLAALHKNDSESKDGMDISICKIYHADSTIEYAGAMRPLWIFGEDGLKEIRPDKIPIGTPQKERRATIQYKTHTVKLKASDSAYLFTDGFADQFGGEKDKKFSTSRFKKLLQDNHTKSFDEQKEILIQEHLSWKGENEQIDDILVIGFRIS